MIAELEKERENILFTQLNKEDEAEVEAKLKKMLGDEDPHDREPLLKYNEDAMALVKHRTAGPNFSIMKARALTTNSMLMNSRMNQSRFDRKGHLID